MSVIELSDELAAALRARAAAQGLSLEDWFRKVAGPEAPGGEARPLRTQYSLSELVTQCDRDAPLSEEDRAWMDVPPTGREAR